MLAQTVPDCEVYATRLADPNLDIKLKVTIATELRDKVEIFQSVEYKRFLALLLPVFTSILRDGQPAFSSNASEQRLRQTILEIIHRFPHNDDLAQYASDLMGLLLRLLRVENEENAVLCLKIIIDLHRTYKELLEEHVQPFLNIVMEMYRNMPKAVADTFDHPCTPAPTSGGTPGSMMMMSPRPSSPADFGDTPAKALARGMHSFKVLTECPIIVVLLFQPHRRSVAANIQSFVPLIMEMLSLQAKPQTEAHAAAAACGEVFVGVSPSIKNRAVYTEFIIAQVKTASFLAYILRGYAAQLRQYQAVIPEAIIRLLRDCPPEASSTRKELLVATRHILSTDFRNAFIDHMDILLNEKVLIGTGVTSHETLRPLAFSMLADLVHHVRTKLALPQLSRTVYMYSRNLHDSTLASSIQTMCAKLLLNLVECIMHLPDRTKGRQLLMRILDTFTNKFQTLNSQFPIVRQRCLRANQQGQKRDTDKTNKEDTSTRGQGKSDDVMDVDLSDILGEDESELDLQRYKSIAVPATSHETHLDTLKDMRFLFRNLVTGLKTIMFGLKSLNPSTISTGQNTTTGTSGASGATPSTSTTATTTATNITSNSNVAIGFSHEEMTVFSRLFREGIRCFDYYVLDATLLSIAEGNTSQAASGSGSATTTTTSNVLSTTSLSSTIDPTSTSSSSSSSSSSDMWTRPVSKEEKETLEQFANVFITVDPAIFQEVFTAQMPYLFERILGNSAILAVPRCFLANESVSHNFSGILISFLVERLDLLGGQDPTCAEAMLRLLKLTFMAVTWFPQQNEEVLQPHLGNIIMSSMKMSAKAKDPIKYFLLLRSLFRYIGGGRFELLYKEVLPLVHMLLESFNTLLSLAHKQEMRELFVELCLTVPVRLSVLLPYLTFLMKPLVIALQAGSELISQGLRTLELCIDNLTQDFLDPIMAPVIDDLMRALWSHLQSNTTNEQYSQSTMRILGKLGGRNRRLLLNPPVLEYRPDNRNELNVELQFPDDIRLTLSIDRYISVAETVLADQQASKHSLEQAYLFVRGCLSLLIDTSDAHMNSQRLMAALRAAVQNAASSATSTSAVNTPNASTSSGSMVLSLVNHSEQQRVKQTHEAELIRLLYLIFRCATIASLKERAQAMLNQIVQHFALLSVLELISISTTATTASSTTADEDIDMTMGSDSNNNGNGNSVHKLAGQSSKIGGPFGPRSLPSHSDKRVFVETLICVITDEDVALRNLAESALQLFYQTCLYCVAASPAGPYTDSDRELAVRIPFFHQLAMKFCSCCYTQQWFRKRGGCLGISLLTAQLDFSPQWMLEHELDFCKALLYILKDASPELSTSGVEEARQTLAHVLKVCNRSDEDESNVERKQKFTNLVGLLVTELSNSNAAVRDTIQSSFQLLADLTGCEVTELLDPVRERLLRPIFTKPLRALPFAMQIGNIDAVTYCLSLRPPFLQCNDELLRLLHEALALADADDQALVSRTSQYKNAASLVNLRVVCIRLLSAAMTCSDFFNNRQSTIRQRIISVFFKSLYNKSSEVVDAAKKGLQQVLTQQHRLPKDLLQTGLRPILRNLSDHKRLTVPDLEGLARLLELLISYFKVEIGNKLLEHMKSWADPQVMQESAGKSLTEVHHIQIIVAIMNVFHLLPALSNIFLNDLVTETIRMEQLLRRDMSSPFRVPLIKFLNRYAAESIDYFLNRLADPSMSRLFLGLLGMEQATAFRSQLLRSPDRLIARAFPAATAHGSTNGDTDATSNETTNIEEVRFQFILIVHQLCTLHSDWLMEHREIVDCLLELWRAPARRTRIQQQEEHMSLNRLQETRLLAETLILYVRRMPEEVDLIFDLLDVFTMPSVVDFSFLKQFLCDEMAIHGTPERKRAILRRFLRLFEPNATETQEMRTQALRILVNPMLLSIFVHRQADQVIDASILEEIQSRIWRPLADQPANADRSNFGDPLRIELLQLTAMLVQYVPQRILMRKDVIKFAYGNIRLDDVTSKQAAYVLIARFIAAFETPPKIINQIFVALLRAHQSEAKHLVKQALDVLTPALPTRLANAPGDHPRFPTWARYTRKVLIEDGHTVSQLVNIYQLVVRHTDQFYTCREYFLPQMVNTLPKLGLVPSATAETRALTLDQVETMIGWEKKLLASLTLMNKDDSKRVASSTNDQSSQQQSLNSKDDMNIDDQGNSAVPVIPPNEYTPNATLKEMILNYLTQFTCATAEYNSTMGADTMSTKALKLLKEAMQLSTWQNVDVNIRYLEVVLITNMDEIKEDKVPAVSAALQVLDFILERKSPQWLIENISLLQRLLSRSLSSGRLDLCERIAPILTRLYAHLPSPDEAQIDVATFYAAIDTILQEGLGGATTAATTTTTTTGGGGSSNTTTTTGGNNANASMTGSGNVSGGSAIGLGGSMNNTTTSLRASLVLLQACCKAKPEYLDSFIPTLSKLLQKLTKEHIQLVTNSAAAAAAAAAASDTSSLMGLASPTGVTNNGNNVGTPLSVTTSGTGGANGGVNASMATTPEQQHLVPALIVLLRLLKSRVSYLGDQRRWLLVSLIQLIERSPDLQLLRAILTMVSEWIKDDQEAFPTTKEKANLMSMLMTLDQRQDRQLIKDFLGLVVDIYENPLFARTELTVRLEHAFLTGLCFNDSELRNRFATIFHKSAGRTFYSRLYYLLGTQHWDAIAKHFWITQACDLLLAGILADAPLTSRTRILSLPSLSKSISKSTNDVADVDDQPLASVLEQQRQLMTELGQLTLADLIQPLQQLLHLDDRIAYDTWVELFQASWPLLSVKERTDLTKALIPLLANPYQSQQATIRPNVPQALLEAAALCQPAVRLPPQLVKYIAKHFGAWHVAVEYLERGHSMDTSGLDEVNRSEELIRESTLDALTELYGHLAEDDLMFGLWRRRCMFSETNNALSFEQCSVWPVAQQMYEQAQLKARSGIQAFTEAEYTLWEEHWIHTTEQLQQWDILHDLARHENNPSLQLEAAWRQMDTPQFDAETMVRCLRVLPEFPRRKGIEAFLLLQENSTNEPDRSSLFHQLCNDGMKLALQQWRSLPSIVHQSHVSLLHVFQMFVELQEAGQMCTLLLDTNAGNFDARFQELKALLQSWRERLPNYWDDMNQWSDLVAWRQLMFGAVNRTFLPLGSVLPPTVTANSAANSGIAGNSLAYRGYHEMAWMINRFARIARKHGMLDVCMNQLARIYTLPNIEIHEAFIKLKEQARCNLKNVGELASGLEVINNTNLAYFGVRQKAEFFALKGDFLARLERNDEANVAYAAATNADLNLPKAWSSWGRFLDGLFQQHPDQIEYASRAMDCYLQACCLQRSPKSRRHIARILWLLSTDDAQGTVAKTFETFKGDVAIWYWLTFIPQLLSQLSSRTARHARLVLERIAKSFPQALHYQLRTMREEYEVLLRRNPSMLKTLRKKATESASNSVSASTSITGGVTENNLGDDGDMHKSSTLPGTDSELNETSTDTGFIKEDSSMMMMDTDDNTVKSEAEQSLLIDQAITDKNDGEEGEEGGEGKKAVEGNESSKDEDETMNKEDGNQKVEVNEDTTKAVDNTEDATSTTTTNANTAANAANTNAATNATTTNTSTSMLQRDHPWEYLDDIMSILKSTNPLLALTMETMIDQILARLKPTSEEDMYRLLVALLNDGIQQLASRLSHNDKDATLSTASLSNIQRIVDILPSGELKTAFARDFVEDRPTLPQYVRRLREWRDSFVAMMAERPTELPLESYSHYLTEFEHQRFDDVEIPGQYSLLKDNNNDFIRIERFEPTVVTTRQQVSYVKNIAIRGHNGTIHPFMIQHPCPRFCRREERLVQLFRLLNSVLERRLETRRRSLQFHLPVAIPLAPQLRLVQLDPSYVTLHDVLETQLNMQDTPVHEPIFKYLELLTELATDDKTALPNIKHEIVESIASTLVPADTLTRYFTRRQQTPADLWMLRKRFTAQWATSTFLTHILGVNARHPHKYHVSLATGNLWTAELFPSQDFAINEAVPFRLTPNLQHFMTPNGLEGIFAVSLLCIADAFIESKTEVEDLLSIFIYDELNSWSNSSIGTTLGSTSGSATTVNATSEHQQTSTASNDTTSSNLKNDSGANTTSKPSNTSHKVTSHADDGESISEEVGMLSAAHVSSSSLDRLGQTTSQTSLDENVDTTMDTEQDEAKDGHHLAESAIQPQAMITAARDTTEKLMRKIQILACRAERDMAWRQLASTSTHQTNGLSTSANTNTTTDGGDAMEVDDVLAAPSEVVPLDQSVLDLIAQATNPQKLAQTNCVWMPWF